MNVGERCLLYELNDVSQIFDIKTFPASFDLFDGFMRILWGFLIAAQESTL